MPLDKVHRLLDTAQAITSLDTPIGDGGAALQDFLGDSSAIGPDELAVEAVGREALEQVLVGRPTLSPRCRQVNQRRPRPASTPAARRATVIKARTRPARDPHAADRAL
jgi:DNA-directed RNA polymerase sigma subunit (sigma70/sigma32)